MLKLCRLLVSRNSLLPESLPDCYLEALQSSRSCEILKRPCRLEEKPLLRQAEPRCRRREKQRRKENCCHLFAVLRRPEISPVICLTSKLLLPSPRKESCRHPLSSLKLPHSCCPEFVDARDKYVCWWQ